jgi:replication factor A1
MNKQLSFSSNLKFWVINLNIKDLADGMKRVNVEGKIVDKGDQREVKSRFKDETYRLCDAVLADETGSIKLTLWDDQMDLVTVGDSVKVENGYITSFKSELQLNIGKFGKLIRVK